MNVYKASEFEGLLPPEGNKNKGFDWEFSPKASVNLRLDRLSEQGPVPGVLGRLEIGGKLKLTSDSKWVNARAELEATGNFDLDKADDWKVPFNREIRQSESGVETRTRLQAGGEHPNWH